MRTRVLMALSILLIFSGMSWAGTCPELTPLPSITGVGGLSPARVAPADNGVIYVTDYFNNLVASYTNDGALIDTLRVSKPLAVAADDAGNIYVGQVREKRTTFSGIVEVYSSDFRRLYSLGSGWGEFEYPLDIVVSGGMVYVADSRTHLVKVYNSADGAHVFSFGGYGREAGNLVSPTALSIDPSTGNVYVADKALQYDPLKRTWGMGAGVHVFSADGAYVSSLPIYFGNNVVAGSYQVNVASGVHVDGDGNVFVTDSARGNMLVFDTAGGYSCDIAISTVTRFPQGVVAGTDGRMYIVTSDGIRVFATADLVDMAVTPDMLSIASQQCSATGSGGMISIINRGGGVLDWSAEADASWIRLDSLAGQINGQGASTVLLSADVTGLGYGTHKGTVTFSSQSGTSAVNVTLEYFGAPVLTVAENSLSFEVRGDKATPSQSLNISLSGDATGTMNWTAAADSAWLGVSPSVGASDTISMAQAGISIAGLSGMEGGTYSGNITVSAGCDSVPPVMIPVTLTYVKGGTITVSSNIAEAGYTITGPAEFSGSGSSFMVDVAPAGSYQITFDYVAGFKAPASYSLDVADGETTEFSGQYLDLRENNKIIVSMGLGQPADSVVLLDGDGSTLGGFAVTGPEATMGASTASGDLDGDGVDDIVTGHDGGIITGYRADGTMIAGLNFRAFGYDSNVVVAVADLDGDGRGEIIAAPGSDTGDAAVIRVFGFDGSSPYDTGIIFTAYQKFLGVELATGDVDGDGVDEFITTRGASSTSGRTVEVRVFKADTSGGPGAWKPLEVNTFAGGTTLAGVSVAVGDLNADAVDEIIIAGVVDSSGGSEISIYDYTGAMNGSFVAVGKDLNIAAGDLDFDGFAEIVAGDGESTGSSSIRVYDSSGTIKAEFQALDAPGGSGVKISLGQIVGQ